MLGIILNGVASSLGALIGFFFKKILSRDQVDSIMIIIGVIVAVIGIQGVIKIEDITLILIYLTIGSLIGVRINIDQKFQDLGNFLERKFNRENSTFGEGFLVGSLMQCIGVLVIMGPLEAALKGDYSLLYLKSTIDFVSSIIFASTYGIGVALTGVSIILYQGLIYGLAGFLRPVLNDLVVSQMSTVGACILLLLSLDLLDIKKSKVPNYLPAIVAPPILYLLKDLVGRFL